MTIHYRLIVIDRSTGAIRSARVSLRVVAGVFTLALSLPILIGVGAKLSAREEIRHLQTTHTMLSMENASYRSEIGALTEQIRSFDGVTEELRTSGMAGLVPASTQTTAALNRAHSVGGTTHGLPMAWSVTPPVSLSPPDEILGLLRSALQVLTDRLPSIERSVERREALAAATPSIWPARGWLAAPFGIRNDPFTGERGFHQGIDVSTAEGQPVYATADGHVEVASYSGDYGNLVILQHGFGLSTRYGHLRRFAVAAGALVRRGDVIGYVGATGRSTGPHVHYEILVNGRPIDPLQILTTAIRP